MKEDGPGSARAVTPQCSRTRLAENAIVAVDLCSCGIMQLHLGALTVRMSPCGVSELIATLQQAVRAQAREQKEGSEALDSHPAMQRRPRGQA